MNSNTNPARGFAGLLQYCNTLQLGVLLMGMVSDWYGRKRALLIFVTLCLAFSTASIFVDHPYAWLAIRFFVGACQMASGTARSVYLVLFYLVFVFSACGVISTGSKLPVSTAYFPVLA